MKVFSQNLPSLVSIGVFTGALILGGGAAEAALVFRVSQESAAGAGNFDNNILGYINPYQTSQSFSEYYGFNTTSNSSFDTTPAPNRPDLTPRRSHLFLVESSVDGVGLFAVHNDFSASTSGVRSGNTAVTQFDIVNDPNGASFLVLDEPAPDAFDVYSTTAIANGTRFQANQRFDSNRTDGVVIGALNGNFDAFASFTAAPAGPGATRLNSFQALSANGSPINLALQPNRRVRIDPLFTLIDQGTNEQDFIARTDANKLLEVEGRAGTLGSNGGLGGDYEVGIGPNGAQADVEDELQVVWQDGQVYNWQLNWNPTTDIATFDVLNDTLGLISSQPVNIEPNIFNAFGLEVKAITDPGRDGIVGTADDQVSPGTTISLFVNQVNGFDILLRDLNNNILSAGAPLSLATTAPDSGRSLLQRFFTASGGTEITSLAGTFSLNWPDGGVNPQARRARSDVTFSLNLFDPPVDGSISAATALSSSDLSSADTTVPEPGSILGLLAIAGAMKVGSSRKGKSQ